MIIIKMTDDLHLSLESHLIPEYFVVWKPALTGKPVLIYCAVSML
jgi:hypothetical protein